VGGMGKGKRASTVTGGIRVGSVMLAVRAHYEETARVMSVAEGYAMVRRKGCYPLVIPVKQLRPK